VAICNPRCNSAPQCIQTLSRRQALRRRIIVAFSLLDSRFVILESAPDRISLMLRLHKFVLQDAVPFPPSFGLTRSNHLGLARVMRLVPRSATVRRAAR
jgi:hypothetical protein